MRKYLYSDMSNNGHSLGLPKPRLQIGAVAAQGHKHVTINVTISGSILTRKNEIYNIFISFQRSAGVYLLSRIFWSIPLKENKTLLAYTY